MMPLAHNPPLADRQGLRIGIHGNTHPLATRIAECRRAIINLGRRHHHAGQFVFVGSGHHHHIGQAPKIRKIKHPRMGCTVCAHQPGAVDGKSHRQALNSHIMHHLIVGALEKRGINRGKRLHPFGGKAGGKGDGVLFGNPHIKAALGEGIGKQVQARARWHGGGYGHNPVVLSGLPHQAFGKYRGIGRGHRLALGLLPGGNIKFCHAVEFIGRTLGRAIATALLCYRMNQHRPRHIGVADVFQDRHQGFKVVAIHRPHIIESHFLEQGTAGHHAACIFLHLAGRLMDARQPTGEVAEGMAEIAVGF